MHKEEALNQIETINKVLEENKKIVTKSSPYLIVWGSISIVGMLLPPYLKEWTALFWIIAGIIGGKISANISKKQDATVGKYREVLGRQVRFVMIIFFVSGMAMSIVLGSTLSNKISEPTIGLLIGMGWIALISVYWFTIGVLSNSSFFVVPSILLLIAATISAILAPHLFYFVIAIFGGGGLLISGLIAKTKDK